MGAVNPKVLKYYARKEIQEEILKAARDREVGASYAPGQYNKRPDILQFPNDVLELAKQGIISFNVSEERWNNPLLLRTGMSKKELDELRTGWDLIIDIDSNYLEYTKIAADLVVKAIKHYNVPVSVKFSGRAGFHIAVPFEAFPETVHNKKTKDLFPDAPKTIALYIDNMIKELLAERILKLHTVEQIQKNTDIPAEKLAEQGKLNISTFLHIDTLLISSRHMFRCCYALNDKSLFASVPVDPENIPAFDISSSYPENVNISKFKFLDRENIPAGSAKDLFMVAYDFASKKKIDTEQKKESKDKFDAISIVANTEFDEIKEMIPEELFPPCIKLTMNGLNDGRKRSIFALINFLNSCNWPWQLIEQRLNEWNKHNKEPLRDADLTAQVKYAKQKNEKILPPNCDNLAYWKDIGVCQPDSTCAKIKNPVSYAGRKMWIRMKENEKKGKSQYQGRRETDRKSHKNTNKLNE